MGLFDKFTKSETVPMNSENINTGNVLNIEFNGFSKSNRDIALKLSALNAGINIISNTIASLPVYKYKIDENGSKIRVKEPINYLLNRSCDGQVTAFDMKNALIQSAIFEGNGYVLIVRDDMFNIEKLVPLKHSEVELRKVNLSDEYIYYISKENYVGTYQYYDVINLVNSTEDGIKGKGILEIGRDIIGLGNAQQRYMGSVISNGAYPKSLMRTPDNLSLTQREEIAQKTKNFFSGNNAGRIMVIPESLQYENISISPADLELLKSAEFTISEIARLLKISPHMIGGEVKSGNYATLEQSNMQFMMYTLNPLIRKIEEVLNMQLLTEEEKQSGDYFFEFNIANMLRSDRKTEMEYYTKALDAGIYSINEVRTKLNENKVDGLDVHLLSKFNAIIKDGEIINTVMNEKVEDTPQANEDMNTSEEN